MNIQCCIIIGSTSRRYIWNEICTKRLAARAENGHVRPEKIQISLRISSVYSEYPMYAFWVAKDATFPHADNKNFHQTALMCRHIWVFVDTHVRSITKTHQYNFDPLKPHFYIVKMGFTGVYIIFLISAQKQRLWHWGLQGYTLFFLFLLKNIDCGYSLEPPRRGGSNEYPQSMFRAEI